MWIGVDVFFVYSSAVAAWVPADWWGCLEELVFVRSVRREREREREREENTYGKVLVVRFGMDGMGGGDENCVWKRCFFAVSWMEVRFVEFLNSIPTLMKAVWSDCFTFFIV